MGIFNKRPLALFSFAFLIASFGTFYLSVHVGFVIALIIFCICTLLFIFGVIIKKARMKLLISGICLFAAVLAIFHSIAFIGIPKQKAQEHIGQRSVLCYVINGEYSTDNVEEYSVKIKNINGADVDIRAVLVCDFNANLGSGDEIYGAAELTDMKVTRSRSDSQLLTVYMNNSENCYVRQTSKSIIETLFSDCGIEILSHKLSDWLKGKLFGNFGLEKGALTMGFLTGDRSNMPAEITRDFRRAGVSHLMAVSGTHIAILLGSIDLILKRLRLHKNIRCIAVAVSGIFFLFVTGFSFSACRSLFMLYAVYFSYFLNEDSDPITSLFVSVALIAVIFPYAVVDIGLIMSFFATLGLLTVYPILEQKIPYPRKKKKPLKKLLLFLRELLLVAIMTVTANMFLLPIIWSLFGEFSLVSVLSNILLSSLSSLFLLLIPLFLIFSKVPLIGSIFKFAVSILADLILAIVGWCSKSPFATVSLRYDFCKIIIILFTVSMCVLLIVKIKHKFLMFIPYGAAVVCFVVCFVVYNAVNSSPSVTYVNYGENECFIIQDNTELSVCDNTNGGMAGYYKLADELESSTATEINKYFLTHYHKGHIIAFDLLTQKEIVRELYLPIPVTNDDIIYAEKLWALAAERGIVAKFYNCGEGVPLTDEINMCVDSSDDGRYISFSGITQSLVYMSPSYYNSELAFDVVIFGEHDVGADKFYTVEDIKAKKIFISSQKIKNIIRLSSIENVYLPKDQNDYKITVTVE